jgi:hypothetical protein
MQALLQGEYGRAQALLDESLALYRERDERRGIGRLLANQAMLALRGGDAARAASLCRESLALYRELGDLWAIGHYLPILAAAVFNQGDATRAARLFGAAAALRERLGTPLPRAVRTIEDGTIAALRAALGDQALAFEQKAGRALPSAGAIAEALSEPR